MMPFWPKLRELHAGFKSGDFHNFPTYHAMVRNRYEVPSYMRNGPVTRQLSLALVSAGFPDEGPDSYVFLLRRFRILRKFLVGAEKAKTFETDLPQKCHAKF